jgi:hypothetical protein
MKKLVMKRLTIVIAILILIIIASFLLLSGNVYDEITAASVSGQTKCVGAKAALKFINERGCERIYEDSKCAERGLVEVRCP